MGEQIKNPLVLTLSQFILTSAFIFLQCSFFIATWGKSHEDIYHSPPHVSEITENIPMTIIRFAS